MQDLRGAEEAAGGEALGWRGSHHDTLPADAGRRVDRRLDLLDRQAPPRRAADDPGLRRRRRPADDHPARPKARARPDRTSVVEGNSVSVRVDIGGCRILYKKK